MAKEDFCFTYYDGDAARDMAHMNRLERGAYTDIIISQRKFGRLTIIQIKKILGKDFEDCWPSIELVLVQDEEKFFIEWVETSILKSKKNSKKNKDRIEKYWNDKNGSDLVIPNEELELPKNDLVIPLGDGDVNEEENVFREEGAGGREPEPVEVERVIEFVDRTTQVKLSPAEIVNYWKAFALGERETAYHSRSKELNHFQNWVKNQSRKNATHKRTSTDKPGTSAARMEALKKWGSTGV